MHEFSNDIGESYDRQFWQCLKAVVEQEEIGSHLLAHLYTHYKEQYTNV